MVKVNTNYTRRLKMRVILYKNKKEVYSTTRYIPNRILTFVQGIPAAEWDLGYFRVTYNPALDYYNHAYFEDPGSLKKLLQEDTEWDLVKEFI